MVFQKTNPFQKSIYENVVFGLRMAGQNNRRVLDEIVERSLCQAWLWDEVKDRLQKSAWSLSGGQMQRLCIARAIANRPEVLLMDEPCAALDPIATAKIEELMDELQKDYTVVIVTHNLQQAARVADTTAFFYLGRLIEKREDGARFSESEAETNGGLHFRPIWLARAFIRLLLRRRSARAKEDCKTEKLTALRCPYL